MTEKQGLRDFIEKLSDQALFRELTATEKLQLGNAQLKLTDIISQEIAEKNSKKQEDRKARKKVNRRWVRAEDWWWKQTGWNRRGHIRRGVSCADLTCEMFSLDITTMKRLPAKMEKEMRDAEFHASSQQTAIVAFHGEGEDMMKGIVQMRVRDFLALHGK